MKFTDELVFLGVKEGVKKDNSPWYLLQLLDEDNHHINVFIPDKKGFDAYELNDKLFIDFEIYYDLKAKQYKLLYEGVVS